MTTEVQAQPQIDALSVRPSRAIFVKTDLERFLTRLLAEARDVLLQRQTTIDELHRGLILAQETGLELQARRYHNRITRRLRDVVRARRIVEALEAGFVPMPRLPAVSLEYVLGLIPPDALLALDEAKKTGLFEEFRVVDGRDAWTSGYPRRSSKARGRDPVLVAMIGAEMFPIAWWK